MYLVNPEAPHALVGLGNAALTDAKAVLTQAIKIFPEEIKEELHKTVMTHIQVQNPTNM